MRKVWAVMLIGGLAIAGCSSSSSDSGDLSIENPASTVAGEPATIDVASLAPFIGVATDAGLTCGEPARSADLSDTTPSAAPEPVVQVDCAGSASTLHVGTFASEADMRAALDVVGVLGCAATGASLPYAVVGTTALVGEGSDATTAANMVSAVAGPAGATVVTPAPCPTQ